MFNRQLKSEILLWNINSLDINIAARLAKNINEIVSKNIFILLNFEKPAKNRTYLNIQNSSGGIGVLLGVLINFKREVFPNYDSKKFINFCTQGLEQQLIKPTKQTKRQVKRRVQKRRGAND